MTSGNRPPKDFIEVISGKYPRSKQRPDNEDYSRYYQETSLDIRC